MVSTRASWPYRITAVLLLAATVAVDVVAKLGPLGQWSAAVDVTVNIVLIICAIAAIVIGERKDRAASRADLDNDY